MTRRSIPSWLIWIAVLAIMLGPVLIAAASPYLAYRNAAYIAGGFAGIVGLALFVIQPMLAVGFLPGVRAARSRRWHRWLGSAIVACVGLHILGLYLTSAQDTLDAMLLVAPTPFSVYGVVALWGIVLTGLLAIFRRRLRPSLWSVIHNAVVLVVVIATIIHALLIEGAMEPFSKWLLCLAVLVSTGAVLLAHWAIRPALRRRRAGVRPAAD